MSLDNMLRLARKVQTAEGAKRYGQAIGSDIAADATKEEKARPVTLERLKSLERQLQVAKKTGDVSQLRKTMRDFQIALNTYAAGKSVTDVMDDLHGSARAVKNVPGSK